MKEGNINRIAAQFPQTEFWMDSMQARDLEFALKNSSRGVTTAPTVGPICLEAELDQWKPVLARLAREMPHASERKILWAWMYEAVAQRSKTMLPLYGDGRSNDGRFAIQANIYDYRNPEKMLAQLDKIATVAENIMIKVPATKAGLVVIEEAAAKGISVMSTMSTSVDQVLAAAAAQQRGLHRRLVQGLDIDKVSTICAMQLNMPDMCIRNYAKLNGLQLSEEALTLGSIAVCKKVYQLFKERGIRSKLLLSNFGTNAHWLDFLGGDLILTMPRRIQNIVDAYEAPVESRIDLPVPQAAIDELLEKVPHYRQAYVEGAMQPEEFEHFVPFVRTARFFMQTYDRAVQIVREVMLPDPYADDQPY